MKETSREEKRRSRSPAVNYFNYYTEIEDHFQRRRGSLLMLSTLDWALIDAWREAGIPLEGVLRGIDAAFDKRQAQPLRRKQKQVNGLAWCAQAVVEQAQAMQEAAVGIDAGADARPEKEDGFSRERIAAHLASCAAAFDAASAPELKEFSQRLRQISAESNSSLLNVEQIERALTMLEEKIFAFLVTHTGDDELIAIREQSSRELAPYKRKMQAAQIAQIERQYLNKRLLAAHRLPRLSLFYMAQN